MHIIKSQIYLVRQSLYCKSILYADNLQLKCGKCVTVLDIKICCSYINETFKTIPTHCTKTPIYVFPEMKLCGVIPNSCIHVSVSNLYIPRKIGRLILGIYKPLTCRYMNVEIVIQNIIFLFWK
jgi:hypothetical protein